MPPLGFNRLQAYGVDAPPGLLGSLLLLLLIVAGALVGLVIQHNWTKALRVASAATGYFVVLAFWLCRGVPHRGRLERLPCWPFCAAGAVAGLLSALLRPSTSVALILVQMSSAALLLGGVHCGAVQWWRAVKGKIGF